MPCPGPESPRAGSEPSGRCTTQGSPLQGDAPMKMVLAMIEPQKLRDVRQSLADIGIYNMTVSTAMGCSRNAAPIKERYRGLEQEVYLFKKIRLEIVVNDDQVDTVVNTVATAARMQIE